MNSIFSLRSRPGTEHGLYEAGVFGQVVTFAARGPWNDETLRRGTREMGAIIRSLDLTKPWCQLSCLYGEPLMQPSVYSYFLEQSKIRLQLGLSVLAIVIKDSDIENTIRHQLKSAYSAANIEHEFFNDIESAIQMMQSAGFSLDCDSINRFFTVNNFSNRY
ncbi:hypothetical protein [Alteromonas halophila]|uniref:Uncharacterized protein n=1 Tax=Alteromonas halophila TaxID=516698 RepID=A0A918MZR4_9ALTE|nr:hypothetical protein [Alteromonas halophila]GGW93624.1 hypothetical protein GCM10007391_30050 [Alteromonas halophila]